MMTRKTTETYEAPKVEIITVETEGMFVSDREGSGGADKENAKWQDSDLYEVEE